MIVEIFETSANEEFSDLSAPLRFSGLDHDGEPGLTLDDLKPVFDKMELPLPIEEVDISWSKDGGYILFLNPYASVLKIFPTDKNGKIFESGIADENGVKAKETRHTGNIYHPASSPPIGVVHFENFAVQLMPGIAQEKHPEWKRDEAFYAMKKDIGGSEFNEYNYGKSGDKVVLLDTVDDINMDNYTGYHKPKGLFGKGSLLNDTLKAAARYEELQQAFYDAWTGELPFKKFWYEMERAKAEGLLVDGWNSSYLDLDFKHKGGNLKDIAKRYEERLDAHNP